MNIRCPEPPQPCVDPAEPVLNWSSEQPDRDSFYGYDYNNHTPDGPPLGRDWRTTSCLGICVSEISQEAADECAYNASLLCLSTNDPGFHQTIYYSAAQSCTVHCPDGSEFTYTVPAGAFSALTQATANAIAHSYACNQAHLNLICLGSLTADCCVGSAYSSRAAINPGSSTVTVSVVSGTLPTGLSLSWTNTGFTIAGVPTVPGEYSFTIRAQDASGNYIQKTFTICILDIMWNANPYGTALPAATSGTIYTLTFSAPCGTSPLSYQVTSGALPAGMALNEVTGILTGTPTTTGTFTFTIGVATAAT